MAQQYRALAGLPEDQGSILAPTGWLTTISSKSPLLASLGTTYTWCRDTHAGKIYLYIK